MASQALKCRDALWEDYRLSTVAGPMPISMSATAVAIGTARRLATSAQAVAELVAALLQQLGPAFLWALG